MSKRKPPKLLKLDLGCGANCREGFTGVDLYNGAQIKCDLMKFPWPWKDNSVEETFSSHFLEHVPGPERIKLMDELHRILIPGGKAIFIVPYWSSARSIQDPTHAWPPIAEQSFLYFNKGWRDANKLGHYLGKCDFDFTFGYLADPETAAKNLESQAFYVKHYLQSVNDLQVVLTKR
jgi:SAM-dependent methyltransferase